MQLPAENNVFILSETIECSGSFGLQSQTSGFESQPAAGYLHDLETSLCFRFPICHNVGLVLRYKVVRIIIPDTNFNCC